MGRDNDQQVVASLGVYPDAALRRRRTSPSERALADRSPYELARFLP
jgi:hypothetical protein